MGTQGGRKTGYSEGGTAVYHTPQATYMPTRVYLSSCPKDSDFVPFNRPAGPGPGPWPWGAYGWGSVAGAATLLLADTSPG